MFWFYVSCKTSLFREMTSTIIASKNHYKCIRVSVLGLHASKVWDKLTNFKNAPLFITSVGAKNLIPWGIYFVTATWISNYLCTTCLVQLSLSFTFTTCLVLLLPGTFIYYPDSFYYPPSAIFIFRTTWMLLISMLGTQKRPLYSCVYFNSEPLPLSKQ